MADSPTSNGRPWFAAGVRFECQPDCGACCTNHGDYSYVYLTPEDVPVLAAHLELTDAEFLDRYTDREDGLIFLKMEQPDCTFLDGTKCSVYPARPMQCRTFPFWPENFRSRRQWKRLCEFCPGVDKGPLHDRESVEHRLEEFERCDKG